MGLQRFLDDIPMLVFLLLITVLMVSFIEIGFRIGGYDRRDRNKAQVAQVRAIMGASLGLLAFMLAFSFSRAQSHYEARIDAYLVEISAIDSAYRGADLLDEPRRTSAKTLLRQFVQLRRDSSYAADTGDLEEAIEIIRDAERIHDKLWKIASSSMSSPGDSIDDSIFVNAILEMIKANDERIQAKLFNRISLVIWFTLFLMSFLSMIVMGYQAQLTGTRSILATWALAFAFAAVMTLVTDLDRPQMSLFKMNQSLMIELQNWIIEDALPAMETK